MGDRLAALVATWPHKRDRLWFKLMRGEVWNGPVEVDGNGDRWRLAIDSGCYQSCERCQIERFLTNERRAA